ncbi:MAG: hypothetical protein JW934_06490 [Anaerolineae bacterium]|nr:hypothetical protein [Anaerolineae bacterium]
MADRQSVINLDWIDEEVRRYRNELITAQQTIGTQAEEIQQQARRIEDLEGRLANTQAQLNRITLLERSLDQYKEEIRLLLEQQDEAYQQDRREAARIKLIEQDNLNRTLGDLRKGLTPIPHLQEQLDLQSAEDQRLNEAHLVVRQKVMDLEKQIDIGVRPIPFLQEQQGRVSKYIAQLQEQTATLLKRSDMVDNRLAAVEEITQRNRQNIEELITIRAELQQGQRRFIEEMQLVEQQRQRLFKEWGGLEEGREERMKAYTEQMRQFTDQAQRIKASLANLESLGERLQRSQHETSELQRLGEERQKTRMEEWEAQAEKRWQREKLLWEQQWHNRDRREAEQMERLSETETRSTDNEGQIVFLWESLLDDIRLRNEMAQNHLIKMSEQSETRRGRKPVRPAKR